MIFPTVCPPAAAALTPCLLYTAPPEKVARLSSSAKDKAVGGWVASRGDGGWVVREGRGRCKLKSSPFSRFLFSPMVLNWNGSTMPINESKNDMTYMGNIGTSYMYICVSYIFASDISNCRIKCSICKKTTVIRYRYLRSSCYISILENLIHIERRTII